MAEASKLYGNVNNVSLLPQADVGASGFYAVSQRVSVLPVATGQISTATAGTAICLYAIRQNKAVVR